MLTAAYASSNRPMMIVVDNANIDTTMVPSYSSPNNVCANSTRPVHCSRDVEAPIVTSNKRPLSGGRDNQPISQSQFHISNTHMQDVSSVLLWSQRVLWLVSKPLVWLHAFVLVQEAVAAVVALAAVAFV